MVFSVMDVDSQMELLRPSKRLVDYYRKKIKEWREKYADLRSQVEECKRICQEDSQSDDELLKVVRETANLQSVIGNIQECLYRERDHVLRLTADNDKFKVEQLHNKKKIQTLMGICGLKEEDLRAPQRTTSKVLRECQNAPKQSTNYKEQKKKAKMQTVLSDFTDYERSILNLKISSLEAQLQEKTALMRDEIESLSEEKRLREKEWEAERKRMEKRIACLNCRIDDVKTKVVAGVAWRLEQERDMWEKESALVNETEKLKQALEECQELLGKRYPTKPRPDPKYLEEMRKLKEQVLQRDNTIGQYRLQVTELQEQIITVRQELAEEKEKHKTTKERVAERHKFLDKKLADEKRRRLLDSEGFRSDIKLLRNRLKSIESLIRQEKLRRRIKEE